jgi:hypothetical protein
MVFVPATSYTSVFIISKKRHHVEEEVEKGREDKGKKGAIEGEEKKIIKSISHIGGGGGGEGKKA